MTEQILDSVLPNFLPSALSSLCLLFLRQSSCLVMQQKCIKHTSPLSHRMLKRYVLKGWDLIKLIILAVKSETFLSESGVVYWAMSTWSCLLFIVEFYAATLTHHKAPAVPTIAFCIISVAIMAGGKKANNILGLLQKYFWRYYFLNGSWGPPEVCASPSENSYKTPILEVWTRNTDCGEKTVAINKNGLFCLKIYHVEQAGSW